MGTVRKKIDDKAKELASKGFSMDVADEACDLAIVCFKAGKFESALEHLIILAACEKVGESDSYTSGAVAANIGKCLHHLGSPFDVEAEGFYTEAITLLEPVAEPNPCFVILGCAPAGGAKRLE